MSTILRDAKVKKKEGIPRLRSLENAAAVFHGEGVVEDEERRN